MLACVPSVQLDLPEMRVAHLYRVLQLPLLVVDRSFVQGFVLAVVDCLSNLTKHCSRVVAADVRVGCNSLALSCSFAAVGTVAVAVADAAAVAADGPLVRCKIVAEDIRPLDLAVVGGIGLDSATGYLATRWSPMGSDQP